MTDTEDWRPQIEAAALVGVSASKLSKLIREGKIKSKKMMRDRRVTWVNLVELRRVLEEDMS